MNERRMQMEMVEEYNIDLQETSMAEAGNGMEGAEIMGDPKDFGDMSGYDEGFEDEDGSGFRNNRGRGNFR